MLNLLLRICFAIFCRPASIDHKKQWRQRNGQVVRIDHMDTMHLHNTIRLLMRKAGQSMVPQLVDLLDERVPPEQFSAFHVLQRMNQDGYKLVNFAHPAYEAIHAQYLKRVNENPRIGTFLGIQLREYEAAVLMDVAKAVETKLVEKATARAVAKAADALGVSVEELNKSVQQAVVVGDEIQLALGGKANVDELVERLGLK